MVTWTRRKVGFPGVTLERQRIAGGRSTIAYNTLVGEGKAGKVT